MNIKRNKLINGLTGDPLLKAGLPNPSSLISVFPALELPNQTRSEKSYICKASSFFSLPESSVWPLYIRLYSTSKTKQFGTKGKANTDISRFRAFETLQKHCSFTLFFAVSLRGRPGILSPYQRWHGKLGLPRLRASSPLAQHSWGSF